ncbi:MAG: type IX secretion system membrane protein PorP/SprF [Flavobacteriaceae bacterium]|nr:type IX secretion system membrane protein PorP/SprF [Flavobacteriaceae bacterium]
MSKYYWTLLFCGFLTFSTMAQTGVVSLLNVPTHNLMKFNRNLVNPSFSLVGEKASHISIYNRRQWIEFDNSPEIFMLNYSGIVSDKVGVGINLYQQNSGVMKNFGVTANYAYRVKMSPKIALTLGFNTAYYTSGLNSSAISTGEPDPALQALDNNAVFKFMPGGNLTIGKFDIGLYAENLVGYDLKTGESLSDFDIDSKTFVGHLIYTQPLQITNGLFAKSSIRVSASNRRSPERGDDLSGNLLFDVPKIGWIQGGYNEFYGYSLGLGINVSKNISFGYMIEKGVSEGIKNFGSTHEFILAYSFEPRRQGIQLSKEKETEKKEIKVNEIEKLKKEVEELKKQQKESALKRLEALKSKQPSNGIRIVTNKKPVDTAEVNPTLNYTNGIPYQYLGKLPTVKNGYYIVTSIFNNEEAAKNKVMLLQAKNRKSAYFKSRKNGNYYVYLDTFLSWNKAKETVRGAYNNSYKGNLWIMDVSGNLLLGKKEVSPKKKTVDTPLPTKVPVVKKLEKIRNVAMEISEVPTGNYLIASVFSKKSNTNRFVTKLQEKGINAAYFINPKNNYHYVYLAHNIDKNVVRKSYYSHVNNTYFEEMWIMTIRAPKNNLFTKKHQKNIIISNVPQGYYLVVNVFKKENNFTKFIAKLKKLGLNPNYISNPSNGFRYVYLKYSKNKSIITTAYFSNMSNSYTGEKWIMKVKNK